jgi:hypothetical protein
MNPLTFSVPSASERHHQRLVNLNNLKAMHVMAYTGIKHNKLWFFLFVTLPDDQTRNRLAKYFVHKDGDTLVYVLDNSYGLEVYAE